ncbi:endonuclease IV [Halalkalibacter wakoensis JCM 9140]|uniref:Endonuclease IV n=1 Tax=Halalkalibacter wakoensis JCM 9140 TaxID=1236970 RepID=W4PZP7_9BACI|nr:deoxyribonuclease IV [Halalkalibacter wakoensis]GAE25217.1 endonuclease IV [Halalkalibacter wakoensis JCM 9140]
MYFGSHVSIRNGYLEAAKTAHQKGANAFQFFPKNPRSISVKEFNQEDAKNCKEYCEEHNIKSIVHSPYPTKLIPETKGAEEQIISSLVNDLEIADACGAIGVVVHFGTTKKLELLEGYKKMIRVLNDVVSRFHGQTMVLIENNAGAGSDMGITLEEMAQVRQLTDNREKIGFCFDTCHAFASGLWNGDNWNEVEEKGLELDYFPHLKAIHLNNSKYPFSSRKDRHANLTTGHLTSEQINTLLSSKVLKDIPFILETPKDEGITHEAEIQWLNDSIHT